MAVKFENFEEVRQYLSDIPNINSGGCGIAALAMARWLRKENWRIKIQFFMGYHDTISFMNNTKSVYDQQRGNKNKPIPVAPSHAGIVVQIDYKKGVEVVDSGGKLDLLRFSYTHTFHDERVIVDAVNNIQTWNDAFRRVNVKRIAKDLDIDMSDIDLRSKYDVYRKEKPIFYKQRKKHLAD